MCRIFKTSQAADKKGMDLPKCCHGDYGVPEGCWDAGEVGSLGAFLSVEHDGGKYDDGHGEGKQEEAQLGSTALQSITQDPQALRVTWELEDPEDAEHPQRDERAAHVLVLRHDQADVVGHDGDDVDDAHDRAHELAAAGRSEKPHEVLECEDEDAGRVHAEKRQRVLLATRQLFLAAFGGSAGDGFHHVRYDRDGDEETRDVVENESHGARVGVFKGAPQAFPRCAVRRKWSIRPHLCLRVLGQTFLVLFLAIPVLFHAAVADNVRHDAIKRQLLVEGLNALLPWVVKLAGSVEVQNVAKHLRVPVEEILLSVLVVEKLLFRAAQQSVGIAVQCVLPCLEAEPAHVYEQDLVVVTLFVHGRFGHGFLGQRKPADGRCPGKR